MKIHEKLWPGVPIHQRESRKRIALPLVPPLWFLATKAISTIFDRPVWSPTLLSQLQNYFPFLPLPLKLGGSWQIIMARAFNVAQLVPYRLSAEKELARPNKCINFAVLVRNFKLRWRVLTADHAELPASSMLF